MESNPGPVEVEESQPISRLERVQRRGSVEPVKRLRSFSLDMRPIPLTWVIGLGGGAALVAMLGFRALLALPLFQSLVDPTLVQRIFWGLSFAVGSVVFLFVFTRLRRQRIEEMCCDGCHQPIHYRERVLGIRLSDESFDGLLDPSQSDVVKAFVAEDWSRLRAAEPLKDWFRDPALLVSIARCKNCRGSFILLGEMHGIHAATNSLLIGAESFLIEVEESSLRDLFEIARQSGWGKPGFFSPYLSVDPCEL